jgi:lysozyme
MNMSEGGLNALVKKFEGCELEAYRCPAKILTIGYGHTSAAGAPEVTEGMKITQEEASRILATDLVKFENYVKSLVKVDLTQHQFDVLVDFCYNAGEEHLATSTLLKYVNAGKFDKVPAELQKWTMGGGKVWPGLVRRRNAECDWWNTGGQPVDEQEQRITPDAPPVKTMADSKQGNTALATSALGVAGIAKTATDHASDIVGQAQSANDLFTQVQSLLSNTTFDLFLVVVLCGAAIWYFRSKHLEEHGV